jgi:hypothetical protein
MPYSNRMKFFYPDALDDIRQRIQARLGLAGTSWRGQSARPNYEDPPAL